MPTTLALFQLWLLSIILISDESAASDFSDLGQMLLGGFVVAVAIAVAFTFVKLRLRDKNPPAQFISISSFQDADEPSKVVRD